MNTDTKSENYLNQTCKKNSDLHLHPSIKGKFYTKSLEVDIKCKLYTEVLNKLIENGLAYTYDRDFKEYGTFLITNDNYMLHDVVYAYISDDMFDYLNNLKKREIEKYQEKDEEELQKLFKSLEADIPILTDKELEKRLNELY